MTIRGPIRIERIVIIILLVGFVMYGLFEAYKLIAGPKVTINYPENGSTIEEPTVTIEGQTENVSFISLNDRMIYVDDQGIFRQKLLLPQGYTILTVVAEDRFKRRVEKKLALWRPLDNETQSSMIEELKKTSTSTSTTTATTTKK